MYSPVCSPYLPWQIFAVGFSVALKYKHSRSRNLCFCWRTQIVYTLCKGSFKLDKFLLFTNKLMRKNDDNF